MILKENYKMSHEGVVKLRMKLAKEEERFHFEVCLIWKSWRKTVPETEGTSYGSYSKVANR